MMRRVVGKVVSGVSKDRSVFIFRVTLVPEYKALRFLGTSGKFRKICILVNTTVKGDT
jgi:hypothetical protein